MRILKYLLLLIFLFLIGLTVFVTTQKGEYDIVRSKIISKPKATIYNYVIDYRNWETFGTWMQEYPDIQFHYSNNVNDKDGFVTWKNNDEIGYAKTVDCKENDSISQKVVWHEMNSTLSWTLKDTLGKTKVSIRTKGKIDLKMKIYSFFNGGITSIVGDYIDKNLVGLDRTLNYELNSYKIKVNGIVEVPKKYFIGQSIHCYDDKVLKNIKIMIPNLIHFFKKNNLSSMGKPFVQYHEESGDAKTSNITVSMAVRDSIHISEGSDMTSGEIATMSALKVTLIGDYSHLKAAKKKALDYINSNQLRQDVTSKAFEIYVKTVQDVKNPSKWVTEIYIPLVPKRVLAPEYSTPKDSLP
jgi:effector-binding domain-containing protein